MSLGPVRKIRSRRSVGTGSNCRRYCASSLRYYWLLSHLVHHHAPRRLYTLLRIPLAPACDADVIRATGGHTATSTSGGNGTCLVFGFDHTGCRNDRHPRLLDKSRSSRSGFARISRPGGCRTVSDVDDFG